MDDTEVGKQLTIEFWGVRGSVPTAEQDKIRVGGNTPCIALRFENEPPVIIDAGTGIRLLGTRLAASMQPVRASILFSHFHWDHIQGLPFFAPLYMEETEVEFYSGVPPATLEQILKGQMDPPYFPVSYSAVRARCAYGQITPKGIEIGSFRLQPVHLHHPGGSTGFRVESPGGSLIYISDHEHGVEPIDDAIVELAKGADLMIYDAHFTPEEYPQYRSWGHSTWLEATHMANRAGVGQLVLFHHSPFRTDDALSVILKKARSEFPATVIACENRDLVISEGPIVKALAGRIRSGKP